MKTYKYTLLKMDGTVEELGRQEEMDYEAMRELLSCQMIELIPRDYYQETWGKDCLVFGDEEGRFNKDNKRNPHMKVLKGNPELGEVEEWDCVGDLLLAQR